MSTPVCPLCRRRRAKRTCPALERKICAVCCGTKRLTEIRCPADCPYLAAAQNHPPAVVQRRQERDGRFLLSIVSDLRPRQYELFFFLQPVLHGIARDGRLPIDDRIVRESAEALAKTYETASRGIIFEHQASSPAAERLSQVLKPLLDDPPAAGGPRVGEHDVALVLRCVGQAAAGAEAALEGGGRAYIELAGRLATPAAGQAQPDRGKETGDESRIIRVAPDRSASSLPDGASGIIPGSSWRKSE